MRLRSRPAAALVLALCACKGADAFVAIPTSLTLSPTTISFGALQSTRQVVATVLDQRGNPIAAAVVTWSSDAPAVASIGAGGLVTSRAIGSTKVRAIVTVKTDSIVDSATVNVTQVAAHFDKSAGDHQIDTVAGTLPTPIAVRVSDSMSQPIPAIIVSFAVTGGGGHLSSAVDTTDGTGRASVAWTLGNATGLNTLSATAASAIPGSPATFTASGVLAGSSSFIAVQAGDGQHGLVGVALNLPVSVILKDGAGVPIPGKQVTFAVASGGGALSGGNAVTDANGIATAGAWTVGTGGNTLTATVADTGIVVGNPVTFTATGDTQAYHVDVRFITTMTATERAAFTLAAAKWQAAIFGDVPDLAVNFAANVCVTGAPPLHETIDDVVIFAVIDSIDGPGKILGQAGPCFVRSTTRLPVVGVMQFDSADVAHLISVGSFDLVIEHEMGHVLGFGTTWQSSGLLVGAGCDSTKDPHFIGAQALAAFDRIGGATYLASAKVPVENTGGSGTCDGHWRESVFKNELMTGFLSFGSNPLSLETIASLGDLGYLVTYSAADPYALSLMLRAEPEAGIAMERDVLQLPIKLVDPAGKVVGTIPPRR